MKNGGRFAAATFFQWAEAGKESSQETFVVPYKQTNDRRDKPGGHYLINPLSFQFFAP